MCGYEEKPWMRSLFLTDIEAVDPLWIFKTTLFLPYLICNFCFHLLAFEIFSYSRLAEVSDGCHTSSWPLKSRHTGIECVGEHENTKVREEEISQIWHGGREGGNNSWGLICSFCVWRLLKWQQEKRFVTERVNKQESNRGCFVMLSAAAQGGRWRLNELERFVLPSGRYHCYKCSGPHNHTLSPLNSPNTVRHPHTYHLIVFFVPFVAMATGIWADCVAGISVKRNYYGQWLFSLFYESF